MAILASHAPRSPLGIPGRPVAQRPASPTPSGSPGWSLRWLLLTLLLQHTMSVFRASDAANRFDL